MRFRNPSIGSLLGCLVAAFPLLLGSSPAAGQTAREAIVVSTASAAGETVSCGCKTKDLGGIARRATIVNRARAQSEAVLLVDAGDFGSPKDFEPWMRTEFQWEMMRKLGYDAVTPGPNEMTRGILKLKELYATAPEIKVVSVNITDQDDNLLWADHAIVEKGGITYAITAVTDGGYYKFNKARGKQTVDDFAFRDPTTALQEILPRLEGKADVMVALLHMSAGDAKRLVQNVQGLDVAIVGHNPGYTFTPEREGQTLLVRGGTRGQYVCVLTLNLDETGRIVDYNGEGHPLGEGVREDDSFKAVVGEFDREFKALEDAEKTAEKTTEGSK